MSGLDDETLEAMLAARADRLPPGTAGEVMAAARAEVRGSRHAAAFSVVPVLAGRSPAMGAGWAAAAMIAVLVMVVLATGSGTVAPSPPRSAAGSPPTSVAGAPSAVVVQPSIRVVPNWAVTPPITVGRLLEQLAAGGLDGRLVLVHGRLRPDYTQPCSVPRCPVPYTLDLVGPVVTDVIGPGQPVAPAAPSSATAPLSGTFAVVPWQGSLILVGEVEGSLASPLSVDGLITASSNIDTASAIALQAVGGTLQRLSDLCSGSTPGRACPTIDLLVDSSAAVGATLASPALGIDATPSSDTGPFLVRVDAGPVFEVVGRYSPADVVTAEVPALTCDRGLSTAGPTCEQVADEALDAEPPPGAAVTAIEVDPGPYCPPGGHCGVVLAEPSPAYRSYHVVEHTATADWVLTLMYSRDGSTVAVSAPAPLATP